MKVNKINHDIYLHCSKEKMLDLAEQLGFKADKARLFSFTACEVKLTLEIDPETAKSEIVAVDGKTLEAEKPKLTIVGNSSGDWEALYVNGTKQDEGHSLRVTEVVKLLGFTVETQEIKEPTDVEGEVDFSEKLEDVKFVPYPEIDLDE